MQQTATQPEHISEVLERVVSSEGSILIQPDAAPRYSTVHVGGETSNGSYGTNGRTGDQMILMGLGFSPSKFSAYSTSPNGRKNGKNHRPSNRLRKAIPAAGKVRASTQTYALFLQETIRTGTAVGRLEHQTDHKRSLFKFYFPRMAARMNVDSMDPAKLGGAFKGVHDYAERRVYGDK